MKTSIATLFKLVFFVSVLALNSCSSKAKTDKKSEKEETVSEKKSLAKRWVLDNKTGNKDNAIEVILSMKENGYFMIYDTITDKKFIEAGINKIQSTSKGQWKLEEKKLILNHIMNDSSRVEEFSIERLDAHKLILVGKNKKQHTYLSH